MVTPKASARSEPLAVYRAAPGAPPLGQWLAAQSPDPRQQLSIVAHFAPGNQQAALSEAGALLAQAGTAGMAARLVVEPGEGGTGLAAFTGESCFTGAKPMSLALFLAAAATFADLDAIDRQVAAFTGAPIGAAGGATQGLDRRLRMRPCYAPLALAWRGDAHDTVVAACPDVGGWRRLPALSGNGDAELPRRLSAGRVYDRPRRCTRSAAIVVDTVRIKSGSTSPSFDVRPPMTPSASSTAMIVE